jgi:murein peptide amidase A
VTAGGSLIRRCKPILPISRSEVRPTLLLSTCAKQVRAYGFSMSAGPIDASHHAQICASDNQLRVGEGRAGTPDFTQRLGKNVRGYAGETIEIEDVLRDCVAAARLHGWAIEEIHAAPKRILALTRYPASGMHHTSSVSGPGLRGRTSEDGPASVKVKRVYVSAGIHGDEPSGPLAARALLQQDAWPPNLEIRLCPCLNPSGFTLNRRENPEGLDLNRQYLAPQAEETLAHISWLNRQPTFDLCLCLHEDWESHGFYLYELNPDGLPSLAEAMIQQVAGSCPIDRSEIIEGRPAHCGIIRPDLDPRSRPQWPEAFYLITHKTRLSYTLEAPSDFALSVRVAALVGAVRTALQLFGGQVPRVRVLPEVVKLPSPGCPVAIAGSTPS